MLSMGIYPLITKPTRITECSATLIDNIFTNNIKGVNKSGIFISDVSDHLPVFVCSQDKLLYKLLHSHVYKRSLNSENIMLFNQSLQTIDWTEVFQCNDVSNAYNKFANIYKKVFDICCLVKKFKVKPTSEYKPWFTKGLQNVCNKKNKLYKQFLKYKSNSSLVKYKKYKNKLTSILRYEQKRHYNNLLIKCKNNIKGSWKILNRVIKVKQQLIVSLIHFKTRIRL